MLRTYPPHPRRTVRLPYLFSYHVYSQHYNTRFALAERVFSGLDIVKPCIQVEKEERREYLDINIALLFFPPRKTRLVTCVMKSKEQQ